MFEGAKTLIGIIITVAPMIMSMFGYDTAPDFTGNATELSMAILSSAGAILVIYGRVKAQGPMWFTKRKN